MPTIEIRTDVAGVPHTFIIVDHPDGNSQGYGFGPEDSGRLIDRGKVHDDTNHEWQETTGKMNISNEQYDKLMAYINKKPAAYNVFTGSQCATWALRGLSEAGIFPDLLALFPNFVETAFFNPYWQYMGFGLNNALDELRKLYNQAFNALFPQHRDPLIIDLDGDGIETIASNAGAYFDHDGNSFAEQTGWAAPDDGLLVRDINGNGSIDNGKELFGDQTVLKNGSNATNGFQALAELDGNQDGKIDSNDAAYSQLRVWQDIDGDGFSAADELHTLEEMGIQSISLDSTPTGKVDSEGNTQTRIGSFVKTDNTTGLIGNYSLQRDTTYTIAEEWLDVPDDIAALPDLQGSGNVYDLQQAMVRDTSGQSKSLVEQFIAATDVNARKNILNQIIFKWAGTEGIAVNSRGGAIDARKLAALEKFFGQAFTGTNGANPTSAAAIPLNESYRGLSEMFYAQLMAQTHLKDLYGEINYNLDETINGVKADMSAVITDIQAALASNPDILGFYRMEVIQI